MRKPRIVVSVDRSSGQWIVTEYHRHGWSVVHRGDDKAEAFDAARAIVDANRDAARFEC